MQGSRASIDSVHRAQEYLGVSGADAGACVATGPRDSASGCQKPDSDQHAGRDSIAESGLGGEHPAVPAPRASLPEAQSGPDDKFHMLVLLSHEQPFSAGSVARTSIDQWQPAFITLDPTPDGPKTGTDAPRPGEVAAKFQSQLAAGQPRPTVRHFPRGMEPSPSRDMRDDGARLSVASCDSASARFVSNGTRMHQAGITAEALSKLGRRAGGDKAGESHLY